MNNKLLVIGGGGHAKVVIDLARGVGEWAIVGVLDDSIAPNEDVLGCPVLGPTSSLLNFKSTDPLVVVAIGSNSARARLHDAVRTAGARLTSLVHPSAVVSRTARIGPGTVVMAGAVINASAELGEGVIINTGAVVEHDCRIGDFCHVGPGSALCGAVTVGARSLIGVGACVVPGVTIGRDCVIGAGAAVVSSAPDGSRLVGVPARELLSRGS